MTEDVTNHTVLMMVSDDGLEGFVDISHLNHENELECFAKLQGEEYVSPYKDLHIEQMKLRCRFNGHRNLELWGITLDLSIDVDKFRDEFNNETKKLVKEKGIQLA